MNSITNNFKMQLSLAEEIVKNMKTINNSTLEVQVFTRITKDIDLLLEKAAEQNERSKSYILRKALVQYLQANNETC